MNLRTSKNYQPYYSCTEMYFMNTIRRHIRRDYRLIRNGYFSARLLLNKYSEEYTMR
jgi:hypothetical protein